MNVTWTKCTGDAWCPFSNVDLAHSHFDRLTGVYIIWHGGNTPRTVYVGQGYFRDRLKEHRENKEIISYGAYGTLYVTCASVANDLMDGVECYLAERLTPLVGDRHPCCPPIAVNLPW